MSAKLMGTLIQEVNLPCKEKWTLTILANYYNEKIGEVYPSIETISKNADLSLSSRIRTLTSSKKQGLALVKERDDIIGVFSDGDLRRCLQKNSDIKKVLVGEVMTKKFKAISPDKLVVQAANMMSENKIFNLLVKDSEKVKGIISMHDILEANVL